METTVKCPICGDPYVFYDGYAFDQSACPKCCSKARGRSLRDRIKKS
jgi:hypothetical protein